MTAAPFSPAVVRSAEDVLDALAAGVLRVSDLATDAVPAPTALEALRLMREHGGAREAATALRVARAVALPFGGAP